MRDRKKPIHVYALTEPTTGEIRYVGMSSDPQGRLCQHMCSAKTGTSPVSKWIASLNGNSPGILILKTVTSAGRNRTLREEAHESEKRTIRLLHGPRLLNIEGVPNPDRILGRDLTFEQRVSLHEARVAAKQVVADVANNRLQEAKDRLEYIRSLGDLKECEV